MYNVRTPKMDHALRLFSHTGNLMRTSLLWYNIAYSLELEFELFLGCRKAPTCNNCHGFIWIPIWVFYYSMKRSPSLLWDGSNLMWIPYQSRSQSLILYRYVFCQRWVCSYMLLLMILRIYCYLIMLWLLGTMEKIRKGLKRDVEVQRSNKGDQAKLESQSNLSWNPIRIPWTVAPKSSHRSHTNSVLDVLYMDRKIRGSTF
jgi:hypothetical protein